MSSETHKHLESISRHFDKMSEAIHHFTEIYKANTHQLSFWKTKSFWSLVVVLASLCVGFSSLYYTGRDALSLLQAYNIQKKTELIRQFKAYEDKAVVVARMTVINQTIDCPVANIQRLKKMKQDRNKTLINIAAYNSGLNVAEDKLIRTYVANMAEKIYSLGYRDICHIKAEKFDRGMQKRLDQFNEVINKMLMKREEKINRLSF